MRVSIDIGRLLSGLAVMAAFSGFGVCETVSEAAPPPEFTAFETPTDPDAGSLISRYLFYHFTHRIPMGLCLFNREFLTVADCWLAGTENLNNGIPIQESHRKQLEAVVMDAEGYVASHQHFSHAHDWGWPFPIWTQAGDPGGNFSNRKMVGWHFQPLDKVPGWVGDAIRAHRMEPWCAPAAVIEWRVEHGTSEGIVENAWRVRCVQAPLVIAWPENVSVIAEESPYFQLRWRMAEMPPDDCPRNPGWIEWKRQDDTDWLPENRMRFYPDKTPLSNHFRHSILPLYRHPGWKGAISALRIVFDGIAPGQAVEIDSFISHYDTRHSINNPVFILACANYYNWTGDTAFLRSQMPRLRTALRYQQTVMGGLQYGFIRNPWPGHDGRPGWIAREDGSREILSNRGIGNNYWDLLPFGGDDFYATAQYYASLLAMADLEQLAREHPELDLPIGADAQDPETLRRHAREVREIANEKFWAADTGRFIPCFDRDGTSYDFGLVFLNLEAIWYGIASPEHAGQIMAWINGDRIIDGDTSTGADIYHWRMAPRATTRRNLSWYGQGWTHPENIPWGGQIQDGGTVLGFTFYDLYARIRVLGPDNAWQRLLEILAWQQDVDAAGGYRAYYADGSRGATLQGCGTAGGIGIDCEFLESSMLPAIIPYGFMGIIPKPDRLVIDPALPSACPALTLRNLSCRGSLMDIQADATRNTITVDIRTAPRDAIVLEMPGYQPEQDLARSSSGTGFRFSGTGSWTFRKKTEK
ncbi:MAG TPA: hypothetical protein PLX03_01275 [Candidatus Hydrogenedentes bacterium]|nr:hypothetical protein [Candidatus Hydrogenedentota bacterium]